MLLVVPGHAAWQLMAVLCSVVACVELSPVGVLRVNEGIRCIAFSMIMFHFGVNLVDVDWTCLLHGSLVLLAVLELVLLGSLGKCDWEGGAVLLEHQLAETDGLGHVVSDAEGDKVFRVERVEDLEGAVACVLEGKCMLHKSDLVLVVHCQVVDSLF